MSTLSLSRMLPAPMAQRLFRQRPEDRLPLTVEHQRIYIVPTRRGCAFLFALLLMLVASINYSLSLGYGLCFLLTGLFAATLLHTYRNLAGVELQGITAGNAYAGSPIDYHLKVINPAHQRRVGIAVSSAAAQAATDMDASERCRVTVSVPTNVRGRHELGRVTLESDYPLGLWVTWSYLHTPVTGLVFPAPESDPPPLPGNASRADGEAPSKALSGDVAGLRDYQPGDALTTVAWKTAARGQGLHVRLFDDEIAGDDLELTLAATGIQGLEAQLSRLTAWILLAEAEGRDYGIELPGTRLEASRGHPHRVAALSALALYGSAST